VTAAAHERAGDLVALVAAAVVVGVIAAGAAIVRRLR